MNDPTQQGGQDLKPTPNARNAVLAQIAQQSHAMQAEDLQGFNEETGEIEQRAEEAQEQQEAQPQAEAKPAEEKKRRSLIVDGQTIEVDEDKILEAGIRTLQKQEAADRRLQEANRLKQEAERLMQQVRQPNTAPSQDEPQTAQATEGIKPEALTTLVQGLEQNITQRVMGTLTAAQAVQKFREEFSDIAQDPDLWMIAVQRNQSRLDHAAAVGAPPGDDLEAYRQIGKEIRSKFAPKADVPQDKTERKRTITAIPALNAKPPAPQEQKPKTLSEQIEDMRRKRAQGYRTYSMKAKGA